MKKFILIIPTVILMGCSQDGYVKQQAELYQVSMTQYQDYNCNQVRAEMRRLSNLIEQQTIAMKPAPKEANNQYLETALSAFAISRGADYSNNNDNQEESAVLQRLKSQYNALDQLAIQKDCIS
jgi:hypothetical protein